MVAKGCASFAADETGPWDIRSLASTNSPPQSDNTTKPLDPDEVKRAYDAIIVAIGIVAVLITNVAFTGCLTPPGGGIGAYWADCNYPMFTAYVYFNGFALVFSTAAIAAVTFGTFVPVKKRYRNWREKVVGVGLWYLGFSLLTLFIAFVLAGFVLATIAPPPLTCVLLRCGEGGIGCRLDNSTDIGVNGTGAWGFMLDPQVVSLNRGQLYELHQDVGDSAHTCCNFNFISDGNSPWSGFSQSPDPDDPCFVLVSADYVLAINATGKLAPPSVAGLVKAGFPRHGRTTWCTSGNVSCDRRLDFQSAFNIYQTVDPGLAEPSDTAFYFFQDYGGRFNLRDGEDAFCLAQSGLGQLHAQYKVLPRRSRNETFMELLSDNLTLQRFNGTFYRDGKRVLAYPDGPKVQAYLQSLSGSAPCVDPSVSGGCNPLGQWVNYPNLRYRCTAPSNPSGGQDATSIRGTLCDYGTLENPLMPPLAVTPDGRSLTKKTLSQFIDIDPGQLTLTAKQVRDGVAAMLAVAVGVNALSFTLFLQLTFPGATFLQHCLSTATATGSHLWRCANPKFAFHPKQDSSCA